MKKKTKKKLFKVIKNQLTKVLEKISEKKYYYCL